jgi:vacuolar-type H+-ATPase subunit H
MHLEVSHDDDIVTFQEWKEQMLSQAIHQAKQDIRNTTTAAAASSSTVDDNNNKSKDTDTDTMDHVNASSSRDDDSISYETALERAADTVLHKYGLLLQV